MKILKIEMPKHNDILYKSFRYPAGEVQTRLTRLGLDSLKHKEGYEIICYDVPDVVELAQLADALNAAKSFYQRSLFLNYLPYGRADRRFVEGDSHGLEVFLRFLGTMEFTTVWTFDIHNEEESLRLARMAGVNLVSFGPTLPMVDQIQPCLNRMRKTSGIDFASMALIAPDKGAQKRYDLESYGLPVFVGEKHRDPEKGTLTGFGIDDNISGARAALIVDDICDGGGTFIGLADEIKKINPGIKLGLYVSHGIFSKGFAEFHSRFDWVFASDFSYRKNGEMKPCEQFKTGNEKTDYKVKP